MKSLLFRHGRSGRMMTITAGRSLVLGSASTLRYSTENTGDTLHEIGEKARSTAEEFARKANEKKEAAQETAEEVMDTAKDAMFGETQAEKERFKEKVEKGNYDKIGRD